jgi:hypothetical protein
MTAEDTGPRKDEEKRHGRGEDATAQDAQMRGRPEHEDRSVDSAQEALARGRAASGATDEMENAQGSTDDTAQEAQMRGRPKGEDRSADSAQDAIERGRSKAEGADEPSGEGGTERAA